MSESVVKSCPNCKPNEFQDKTYGKNNRAMNMTKDKKFRCTCCGQKKD